MVVRGNPSKRKPLAWLFSAMVFSMIWTMILGQLLAKEVTGGDIEEIKLLDEAF
jgi:hypothetical protein